MKRLLPPLLPLSLLLSACPERTPSELRPLFDSLENLPGLPPETDCGADPNCCLEEGWCRDVETLTIRNVGDRDVHVAAVRIAELDGHAGEESAFSKATIDLGEGDALGPDEQLIVRFRYTTPDGAGRSAKIVIESDAEVNPTLEIEVHALDYAPLPPSDGGTNDAGSGDAGSGDAGGDAGAGDAGAGDAGNNDAGAGDDAGTTDAGVGDAGTADGG